MDKLREIVKACTSLWVNLHKKAGRDDVDVGRQGKQAASLDIDEEFVHQVNEFIDEYRQALKALAGE